MVTQQLIRKYPIISEQIEPQELAVLLDKLESALLTNVVGNVVEFGCYAGTTSLFIRRMLNAYDFVGEYHVYDSFAGLPSKTAKDYSAAGKQFIEGELSVSRKIFARNFAKAGLSLPIIHKGWFSDLTPNNVPDNICFAFFDGDFYESIRDSFWACRNKFCPSAIIVVDDYQNESLPGVARAVDEWMHSFPDAMLHIQSSLAIIRL